MYVDTTKGKHGDLFISGSVTYVQRPRPYEDEQAYHQVTVKTSNFVHSDMLGKNDQWAPPKTTCHIQSLNLSLNIKAVQIHNVDDF
ncbi:hypothetical protein JG687_00017772 [Phytophthora cactorum]|uniref:Uncharacterized protein n=1 Tax=Phytophthora cactorum TaxID=29920 RepID=A0A8T1TQQ6_9STRA|nr:hypothetical protein JG687_00017772 [Phytophthora cactorum]